MAFKVIEIIDGDTFKVSPGWKFKDKTGDLVRPTGYDAPEKNTPEYSKATKKLSDLILNKEVEMKNPIKLSYERLLCDVYYNDKNLADYFPEYK